MLSQVEHEKSCITFGPVLVLFSWLHQMPDDLDQHCFLERVSKFEKDMSTVGLTGRHYVWPDLVPSYLTLCQSDIIPVRTF